jgi:hypothetical protein
MIVPQKTQDGTADDVGEPCPGGYSDEVGEVSGGRIVAIAAL